jgi:hypothetical protein
MDFSSFMSDSPGGYGALAGEYGGQLDTQLPFFGNVQGDEDLLRKIREAGNSPDFSALMKMLSAGKGIAQPQVQQAQPALSAMPQMMGGAGMVPGRSGPAGQAMPMPKLSPLQLQQALMTLRKRMGGGMM